MTILLLAGLDAANSAAVSLSSSSSSNAASSALCFFDFSFCWSEVLSDWISCAVLDMLELFSLPFPFVVSFCFCSFFFVGAGSPFNSSTGRAVAFTAAGLLGLVPLVDALPPAYFFPSMCLFMVVTLRLYLVPTSVAGVAILPSYIWSFTYLYTMPATTFLALSSTRYPHAVGRKGKF